MFADYERGMIILMFKKIEKEQLPDCLEVIHKSFATVAEELGLTKENCPTHTSFMKIEKTLIIYLLQLDTWNGVNLHILSHFQKLRKSIFPTLLMDMTQ